MFISTNSAELCSFMFAFNNSMIYLFADDEFNNVVLGRNNVFADAGSESCKNGTSSDQNCDGVEWLGRVQSTVYHRPAKVFASE